MRYADVRMLLPSRALATLLLLGATTAVAEPDGLTHLGAHLDVGIPEGAAAGLTVRLLPQLRGEVGLGTDFAKFGIRVAAVASTGAHFVAPTLSVAYGHLFIGSTGLLVQQAVGTRGYAAETFKSVSYNYVSGQVGLDIGPPQRFQFFIRAGLSYVVAVAHDYQRVLREVTRDPTLEAADPVLRLTLPTLSVGATVYFF